MSNALSPSGGFGLSPNHTMEIKKDKTSLSFQSQPQKVVLFGFSKHEVSKKFSEVISEKKAKATFGEGSVLHQMIAAAYSAYPGTQCYAYVMGIEAEGIENEISIDFSHIPDDQFTHFVLPFFDQAKINDFIDELDKRWNIENQIDGHLFVADDSSVEQLKLRYDNDADKLGNSKHLTVIDTIESSKPTWVWAATLAAVNAKHALTPSRPYSSLELPGVNSFSTDEKTPLVKHRPREIRDQLLKSGISTIKVSSGKIFIDRLVTTYSKENENDTFDDSYRDLNAKQTISAIRYDWLNFVNKKFHRFVLSQDDTQNGDFIATPKSMMSLAVDRHNTWMEKLLVQDPEGKFIEGLRVVVAEDGEHFLSYLPVHLMGQLRGTHTILAFGKGKA